LNHFLKDRYAQFFCQTISVGHYPCVKQRSSRFGWLRQFSKAISRCILQGQHVTAMIRASCMRHDRSTKA
jgi:hypothetical protein